MSRAGRIRLRLRAWGSWPGRPRKHPLEALSARSRRLRKSLLASLRAAPPIRPGQVGEPAAR